MHFLHPFTLVFILLLITNLVIIYALFRSNRTRKNLNAKLIADWQLQNTYMDHTLEFCQKAKEITLQVRSTIDSQIASIEGEEACVEKCGHLLDYMHGGSSAAEALLFHKKNLCDINNIEFRDNIKVLPPEGALPEIDTVSVLGNLFDNAIEAAKASATADSPDALMPFVDITSTIKKNTWVLKVENSKNPNLTPKKDGMKTTKLDKNNHGLGMNILHTTVSKHNGMIKTADMGSTFVVNAFLTIKKARKDK